VGSIVFREGDGGETMFVIRKGKVRISKHVRGGEKTFATLGPGEFFGEMALLNRKTRSASATIVEDATLIEVGPKQFEGMITKQPEIAARIIQMLAGRLNEADQLITILTKRDPKTRVILGLIREAEERGFPGETEDSLVVTRDLDDLSEQVGVKRLEADELVGRLIRVGLARPVSDGLELLSIAKLNEFLSFLEQRGIVHE
jgi:CRP-like cAMP-binding protein